ncbi:MULTISPECIES: amino acid permease [Fictibacillus]|uniref:Transporter n=1 Tax=Fictibacillus enclensis TaxID=1017270 RepID=A0A0V8JBC1_9BACL|nr:MULTISPECIES: amino acid permease [Fictibacillus]KSU84334.1 transporter [Fictibacillus enclensis]RXZ00042.1 amino acid permease [Fictibacillus sp. S7]SCB77407.1 amino acid/polyamine/organocation transporter, APC superfamily [Fictibacillus enclensis]
MSQTKCSSPSGQNSRGGNLTWWQLSLMGIGCTIGTGYFLGSSIGIMMTGPSIVISFVLAALGTYIVFNVLAKMTAEDPQKGSFCAYAKKAFGHWAGFSCGWNYWLSNILVMGSQLTALSILSRFWFEQVPLWVFASGYAILAIIVVLTGTNGFDKVENILAVVKVAAILMFIIIAGATLLGWLDGDVKKPGLPDSPSDFFHDGFPGFWSSLIYAFYAFGGIEVIGLMAMQLKKKEDGPKAGKVMMFVLAAIYVVSMGLAVTMVFQGAFDDKESPFVTALDDYHLAFFPHVFNGAIIIAGFSTMTASLFGVTNLLCTMSEDGDAPSLFSKKIKKLKDLPLASLGLGAAGLLASIITALLMPGKIYEYITTAAGILLLYNWLFIILSSMKMLKQKMWSKVFSVVGLLLILASISGTLAEKSIRPGFYVSILLAGIIGIVAFFMRKVWKRTETS